jgi:hypothetical protein
MVSTGASRDRLMHEIAKCDVLCSNCHMELHYMEGRETAM